MPFLELNWKVTWNFVWIDMDGNEKWTAGEEWEKHNSEESFTLSLASVNFTSLRSEDLGSYNRKSDL